MLELILHDFDISIFDRRYGVKWVLTASIQLVP